MVDGILMMISKEEIKKPGERSSKWKLYFATKIWVWLLHGGHKMPYTIIDRQRIKWSTIRGPKNAGNCSSDQIKKSSLFYHIFKNDKYTVFQLIGEGKLEEIEQMKFPWLRNIYLIVAILLPMRRKHIKKKKKVPAELLFSAQLRKLLFSMQ